MAYYQVGGCYKNAEKSKSYGTSVNEGDIIEICLNLKGKNELSLTIYDFISKVRLLYYLVMLRIDLNTINFVSFCRF